MESYTNGYTIIENHQIKSNNCVNQTQALVGTIVTLSYLALIIAMSITCNIINLIMIYKTTLLHNRNNILIAHLAIVDLLTAVTVLPLAISYTLLRNQMPPWTCQTFAFLSQFLDSISVFNTLAISIDRCIAVTSPYYYSQYWTVKILKYEIVILWVMPILICIWPLLKITDLPLGQFEYLPRAAQCWINFRQNYNFISSLTIITVMTSTFFIIILCYIIIFIVAYGKNIRNPPNIRNLKKSIRTTTLIVGANIVCWLPILITSWLSFTQPQRNYPANIDKISLMLCYSHTAFNPVIYSITNRILRNKLKRIAKMRRALIVPTSELVTTPYPLRRPHPAMAISSSAIPIQT